MNKTWISLLRDVMYIQEPEIMALCRKKMQKKAKKIRENSK